MEFWDVYKHVDPKVIYIPESIMTQEIEDLISYQLSGCNCDGLCTVTCPCVDRSGAYYSFTNKHQLDSYIINFSRNTPVYECNDNCSCKNIICGNKLVQFGPRKLLEVIDTKTKGFGLFSNETIEKGNFICEYAGEIINESEAKKRYETYSRLNFEHNYLFCINENFGDKNEKTFIDPSFYGNIGRYINHSCKPNAILVPVRINYEIPSLYIFAKETIDRKIEICFDYGQSDGDGSSSLKKCECMSENCRKFLPFDATI